MKMKMKMKMKMICSTSTTTTTTTSSWLRVPNKTPFEIPNSNSYLLNLPIRRPVHHIRAAPNKTNTTSNPNPNPKHQDVDEVEEDMPWIQEKALDFVEFTGSVTQAIPGPRVAHTSLPWIIAPPLAFVGVTFVVAFVNTVLKTLRKFNSPKQKRRQLVNKNALLNKSIDELLNNGTEELQYSALQDLIKKTGFSVEEILRKYIRYALNEKPFDGDLVVSLLQLRKLSMLADSQVAQSLNEISTRIVRDKGPVVMDASGYSEKGFKRKLAVQALFSKVFYLSELPEFCSRDSSLIVKEIFGVTDEDADQLRIHTLSNIGDMETLEKMVEDGSEFDDSSKS